MKRNSNCSLPSLYVKKTCGSNLSQNYGILGKNSGVLLLVPFLGVRNKNYFPLLFSNNQIKWPEAF